MNGIADLKQKAIDKLAHIDLESMSLYEMEKYVDLVGRISAIQERNYLDEYTQILKGIVPEKREEKPLEALGLATFGSC